MDTFVEFGAASATAAETDADFTVDLPISVTNPSATPVDVTVDFVEGSSTGTSADIGGFTGTIVNIPANTASGVVTITITGDGDIEPNETFVFEITAVSGGTNATIGTQSTYTLTVTDDDTPLCTTCFINEVDADSPGTDAAEFVELYNGGLGVTSLDGYVLVFFNGSNNTAYEAYDLDGFTTDANGLFVAGNAGVNGAQLTFPGNTLQNGTDAVALYLGDAADFPDGTAPTTVNLVDAYVYGSGREAALLAALGQTVQYRESYEGSVDTQSLQRLDLNPGTEARGAGVIPVSELFYALPPTPGAANIPFVTVDRTAEVWNPSSAVGDGAGWRHLSSPVVLPTRPLMIGDYAAVNLVQGVPAGTTFPEQYPNAGHNMRTGYINGGFVLPTTTDEPLPPGRGFFWYWYDETFTPPAGNPGTSVSWELADPGFDFSVSGVPLDDAVEAMLPTPLPREMPVSSDGFYSLGNVYAYPFRLGGVTASTGTLSTNFYVWDPETVSYQTLVADTADPFAGAALPVANGVFAQVTGPAAATVTFGSSSAYVDPTADPGFIGRTGGGDEARLALHLSGHLGQTPVSDRAATLRFRDDAVAGWDRHDASKLMPPTATYALLAPVGEYDGATALQGVRSLPLAFGSVAMPVAFTTTAAGTFTLTPDGLASLPSGWSVTLTDHVAATTVDLRAGGYTFAADAGGWAERFTLTVSSVTTGNEPGAAAFALTEAAPNPARGRTALTLTLAAPEHVRADVFDALGRRVATLFDGALAAGQAQPLVLDAAALAPGAYVVRVTGASFAETRRVTVVR